LGVIYEQKIVSVSKVAKNKKISYADSVIEKRKHILTQARCLNNLHTLSIRFKSRNPVDKSIASNGYLSRKFCTVADLCTEQLYYLKQKLP
jgi:hypothetical protein